jgi:DNA polymerase alpha-associated DNA helicase A
MRDFEVWKSYIDAIDILNDQHSEPFDIIVLGVKNETSIVCRYIDDNQKEKILKGLKKVFQNLKEENINYQCNYLLYPSSESINSSELDALKMVAESSHFEFSSKPAYSGTFKYTRTPLNDFIKQNVVKEEEPQEESTLINHIKRQYPDSIFKVIKNGKIIVLDETYLKDLALDEWRQNYLHRYTISAKEIMSPVNLSLQSRKIVDISHSKKRKKLVLKLDGKVTESEIKEIRKNVDDALFQKLGGTHETIFKTILTKTNYQDSVDNFEHLNKSFSNTQFLTLDELDKIDALLELNNEVYREESIGAIFKIDASNSFIIKQFEDAKRYLQEKLGISNYYIDEFFKQLHFKDIFLRQEICEDIQEKTFFSNSFHLISYTIEPSEFEKFEQTRKSKRIYYESEENDNTDGNFIPNPDRNIFSQTISTPISLIDLRYKNFLFLNMLEHYFDKEYIQIEHKHIFMIDKQRFFNQIKDVIPNDDFHINSSAETISFDFKTRDGLKEKLQKLDSYKSLNYLSFKEVHKYKITFRDTSPLTEIKEKLDKLTFTKTFLNKSGNELHVFGLMSDINLYPIVRANIENTAGEYDQNCIQLSWDDFDEGFIKYYFRFDEESYQKEVHKKLNRLRGEPLSLVDTKDTLGILKSISYPKLTLLVKDETLFDEGSLLSVKGALKGKKDKVKRLRDTIKKIYSDSGSSTCSKNVMKALIDSSTLVPFVDGDITLTNEYKKLYQKVNNDLLSPYANERQKETIVKCLLCKDLFIVQGPPGTGKSTAIAEFIWQHIVNNDQVDHYRTLVTSETNLAVDNALDKLRSNSHLLIKPIRFGREEKLDSEGIRFSLRALNSWKVDGWESEEPLIVDDWVELISNRCINPKNNSYINQWKDHLAEKNMVLREFVHKSYISNCNVIGATCSSIGKFNSVGNFTRFFQEYSNVFYMEDFERFKSSPNRSTATTLKKREIEFELAIQDEASKASPPELALPFTFGGKAVIIGDHRQLPPLIDTNEFIESLDYLKEKSKEEDQVKKIGELIQFIQHNRESFENSHFERLFKNIDPNRKSTFDTQYRMHPAINETIKQFYKGDFEDGKDLECGLSADSIDDPNLNNLMSRYHGITKKKDTHVMWFDVQTPEIKKGTSRINPGEVKAINWIIKSLISNENYTSFINHWKGNEREQKELGVITFYGAQAGLIKKNIPQCDEVRVSPVDRFQGMERNIVIVSLVRSNIIAESEDEIADFDMYPESGFAYNGSLGFAESPNRLNVALSRAKRLLIVVGNSKHFSKKEIYKNVFETIKKHPQGEVWLFDGEKPNRA